MQLVKSFVGGGTVRRPEQVIAGLLLNEQTLIDFRSKGGPNVRDVQHFLPRKRQQQHDESTHFDNRPGLSGARCLGAPAKWDGQKHGCGFAAWQCRTELEFIDRVKQHLVQENEDECYNQFSWEPRHFANPARLRVRIYNKALINGFERVTSRLWQRAMARVTSKDSSHVCVKYGAVRDTQPWVGQVAYFATIEAIDEEGQVDEARPPLRFAVVDFYKHHQPINDADFDTCYKAYQDDWDLRENAHRYPVLLTQISSKLCYCVAHKLNGRLAESGGKACMLFCAYHHVSGFPEV